MKTKKIKVIVTDYAVKVDFNVFLDDKHVIPISFKEDYSPTEYDERGTGLSAGCLELFVNKYKRIFKKLGEEKQNKIILEAIKVLNKQQKEDCDFDIFSPIAIEIKDEVRLLGLIREELVDSTFEYREPKEEEE